MDGPLDEHDRDEYPAICGPHTRRARSPEQGANHPVPAKKRTAPGHGWGSWAEKQCEKPRRTRKRGRN